jgi:hypothetical protein
MGRQPKKFDDIVSSIPHEIGKEARSVLEERGCRKCKPGKERFFYTHAYFKGKRVYIEVTCKTCGKVEKVLMPELSPEDVVKEDT